MKEEIKQIAMNHLKDFGIKVIELASEHLTKLATELAMAKDSNKIAKETALDDQANF